MATAYNQIENNTLNLSTTMKQEIPILNDKFGIATESAEKTEGTIELSVGNALLQMITYSDNYAALLLAERVRLSNVTRFLKDNEFIHSHIGQPPLTTPKDTALFLEKLYKGEIVSKNASNNMLGLLKQQRLRNKLPKYLPVNTKIAHKTGELGFFEHDAGIVYTNKGDYIIAVFSKSKFPEKSEEIIALLSKNVYSYFTKD